jgi:hypothetical protein
MKGVLAGIAMATALVSFGSTDHPATEISNGLIKARIFVPDSRNGFYRGTRFDWSGTIYSLEAKGHEYYGPWFTKTDPAVHDFVYRDEDIVAGPCSADVGPVDEFAPVGFQEAKPGGTFVKIGVGALRKTADTKYDNYHLYEIVDGGHWSIQRRDAGVRFVQELRDINSGYAYVYEKDLQLTPSKPEMVLGHRLKNVGSRAIRTTVYNHNFLVLDGRRPPGPGVTISVPFAIRAARPFENGLAEVRGNRIVYLKKLQGHDTVATQIEGFGKSAADNTFRIEDTSASAGISARGDRPLLHEALWSIRSVIAMEPHISIDLEPGAEFTWNTGYEYYAIPPATQHGAAVSR